MYLFVEIFAAVVVVATFIIVKTPTFLKETYQKQPDSTTHRSNVMQ